MEMKSEVGVCSEDEVGGGVGEGKGCTIMSQRSEMEVGVCDRVDATESMEWRSRHGSRADEWQ